jgi:hypothetical protein
MLSFIDVELNETGFAFGLAVFGIGVGMLASQLGNVIMSSVAPAQTNEAGGLQGTAQNLGASLGTALIGAIMLGTMATGLADRIVENPAVPPDVQAAVVEAAESGGLVVIPAAEVETKLVDAGLPPDQVAAISADYSAALLDGLRVAIGAVAVFALLGLVHPPAAGQERHHLEAVPRQAAKGPPRPTPGPGPHRRQVAAVHELASRRTARGGNRGRSRCR